MASLSLQGISKTFKHRQQFVHALRSVDLAVEDGELLVVVGPSGCGKTTMLRLIAGLDKPDAGQIQIDGAVVNGVPPKDRDVAMVFQDYALYPHMTVFKNLAFPLKMRRAPRQEIARKVDAAAEMLGIGHLLERKPAELSGGEQQRVALGRAVVREPRLFLFDEPLSNLDPALRVRMRSEIKNLHRRLGTTMVYVTHDQEEAMVLGDRVAVLRAGELQQVATPLNAYDSPANRFVAEFFGQPAMNFLPGRLIRERQSVQIDLGGSRFPFSPVQASSAESEINVEIGLRPQHLRVSLPSQIAPAEYVRLAGGRVEAVDHLGDSATLHILTDSGDCVLVKSAPPNGLAFGSMVQVSFDPRKVTVFKADESGERLF